MTDTTHRQPTPVLAGTRTDTRGDTTGRRTGLLLGAALVAMALVAGLSFTFAAAVMPNLADADDHTFVVITQRFNDNPVFPMTFTLAPVLVALAAVVHRRRGGGVAARWTIAAAVCCGIVIVITGAIHIPLNMDIDKADAGRVAELADARDQFEGPWVAWNVVRTVFAIATVATLGRALFLHGRETATPTAARGAEPPSWSPPTAPRSHR